MPQIGPVIAYFNDRYVLPIYLLIFSIFSSYWWSGFPYDNLCRDHSHHNSNSNETRYEFCDQDLLWVKFPVSDDNEWMTDDQRVITNLFGWTSLVILLIILCRFSIKVLNYVKTFFASDYEPDGRDMLINFTDIEDRCAFVPEVYSDYSPYPLIVGYIKDMDDELFDWASDEHPYDYYNVTLDLKDILSAAEYEEASTRNIFSLVKDWSITEDASS